MSSWTTCPCCDRMLGLRKDGAFRVHGRNGGDCPGSGRTVAQILQRDDSESHREGERP